jgi:rod shape-determining protein MreD
MRRLWPVLIIGTSLVVAVLVQVGLLALLPLPGATPHLVLVVVAALAIARGPGVGAMTGFAGGLLLDLAPPAAHAAGQWALVLTLAGYLAGQLGDPRLRTGTRFVLVGALAALATSAYVTVSGLLGAPWPAATELAGLAGTAAAYGALVAAVVLPACTWAVRRSAAPPRTAW